MDNKKKLATLVTQDTRRSQKNKNIQHNMCWTPPCTRWKKAKNTTQYVLDTTIRKHVIM